MTVPANLHISPTSRESPVPPLRERVEQKFFIRPDRMDLAMGLLFRACRRDPDFPDGQVNSLYFDTPDLEEHQRSDAGDSDKDKIRIRWYGAECDPHRRAATANGGGAPGVPVSEPLSPAPADTVQVWLERKSRRGFASTKQRLAVEVPSATLAHSALARGIVPPDLLLQTMARFGFLPRAGRLCPVIAISYSRYRFVEPATGFRVSLDWRIRSSVVMPGLGRGERGLALPGAIVEVKGATFSTPPALLALAEIGSSWTRYSKYSSSIEAHAADLGTVARTWPAGVLEPEPGHIGRVRTPVGGRATRPGPGWAAGLEGVAVPQVGLAADVSGETLELDREG